MGNIYISIIRKNCKEISSVLNDNGLLEVTVPQKFSDASITKYFRDIDADKYEEIVKIQKKGSTAFRTKVQDLVEKYRNEFKLDFIIKTRLPKKMHNIEDYHLECHGIVFEGRFSISLIFQFYSDELLEKMVKYYVYKIANEYEVQCERITGMTVGVIESDGNTSKSKISDVGPVYRIPISYEELDTLERDFISSFNEFVEGYNKNPVYSI